MVTHAELSGATGRRGGTYRALCGHVVMPGSMLEPPSPACVTCVRFVRVHPSVVTPERASELRQRRGRGPIAAYLARLMAPVGTGVTPTSPVPTGLHPDRGET
ncbi:hypothetical protein H0B56_20295 [Haloechinothrix sp. YIM 98757]|uniref:Uncharacterized protein n=1 Tax=Haloechinothrix aidingensis TaxID=2752311 RepID=A0A838AF62_9PSEU|nr:hypothetical protein [Haloechinothrix aidingensis]MBA0127893.1 hypothetical protein [Haloechinothrix aidingensis]